MEHQGSSFLSGCAPFHDLVFFAKQLDEPAQRGAVNSSFFCMDGPDWLKYDEVVSWPAIAMATAKPEGANRVVVAIGPSGQFWELDAPAAVERLGRVVDEPVTLRALATIDGAIYACGMGRKVYLRDESGRWKRAGPNAAVPQDLVVVGFESLAGWSRDEIYAVGWQGEIWVLEGSMWRQIDSPVSANLNAACCGGDGQVYVVGDDGTLVCGRGDAWRVLQTGRPENLMDVCWHDGKLYVVTDFRILTLRDDALVDASGFAVAQDRPATCLHLLVAEDGVISMGPKDLFRLHGGIWARLA